jgi:hypothetical protein
MIWGKQKQKIWRGGLFFSFLFENNKKCSESPEMARKLIGQISACVDGG